MLPAAEAAVEAYARGWALSGGPMTARVRAGCIAAAGLAAEHAGEPGIMEATLRRGQLEGVWATVYARQDHLYAISAEAVAVLWRKLLHGLDIAAVVDAIRREAAMTDTGPAPGTDSASKTAAKYHKRAVRDIAALLIAGLLAGLPSVKLWADYLAAIAAALGAAAAEGFAAALAVAASQRGHAGFDWAAAVKDGQRSGALPQGSAEAIAAAITAGVVTDLAVMLAGMAAAGATAAAMTAAVRAYLRDPKALGFYLGDGMHASSSAATLAVFAQAQVERVLFITAGDIYVCATCDGYEAENPYTPETCPFIPVHGRCVIGSTRVSAPGIVVAAEEPDGLPSDPSVCRDGDAGEIGQATAPTVAEAERDFGRGNIRAVSERDYVGDVITIRTALGYELTATPNHPIATRGGWVPIAELAVGDHVLSSTRAEWMAASVNPDVNDVPPRIEDVAQALPVLFGAVPTAAEDFHGDGAGSDVCVIRADSLLGDDFTAALAEHASEGQLGGTHGLDVGFPFTGESPLAPLLESVLLASDSIMRSSSERRTLGWSGGTHADEHALATAARLDAGVKQSLADRSAGDTESLAERLLALAIQVPPDDLSRMGRQSRDSLGRTVRPAQGDARLMQPVEDRPVADAEGFCDRLATLSAGITTDDIVHVERYPFRGHVYNLDTSAGCYFGNGILTHNCRCNAHAEGGNSALFDMLAQYLTDRRAA